MGLHLQGPRRTVDREALPGSVIMRPTSQLREGTVESR
jgi:hypothetical protein